MTNTPRGIWVDKADEPARASLAPARTARHKAERGATLIEAALTSLVFFMFVFAALEFGRAYNIYQVSTNAAREGARFAVAPCAFASTAACPFGANTLPPVASISSKVTDYLQTASVAGTTTICQGYVDTSGSPRHNGDCTPWPDSGCTVLEKVPTCYTRVRVRAPYRFLVFPFGTINMTVQAGMRNESN